ncbi:MAG: hypothetical protein IJY24_04160 [Clostridia bacterium]|nr:hypothetical protein [Clostridia bacterium]
MAKNNNQPMTRAEREAQEAKTLKRDKIILIVFAIVALVGIVGTIIFVCVSEMLKNKSYADLDYTTDVSGYLSIAPEDYKSFDVKLNLDKPGEMQVRQEIIKALYANRDKDPVYKDNQKNVVVKVGHDVNIYYVGYTLDDSGNKNYFNGGSNLADKVTALGIGSGKMITGFELALIDKNPLDYQSIRVRSVKGGNPIVDEGDIVCISYTGIFFDNSKSGKNLTATINLSDPNVKEIWGEELIEGLIGASVGETVKTVDADGNEKTASFYHNRTDKEGVVETDTYTDVVINKAFDVSDGEPLTIDVSFPKNYGESTLAGKPVKFDIYIMTSMVYNAPEYNDEFVTKTLGISEEELAEYEGETVLQKYESKLLFDLNKTYDDDVLNLVQSAMWEHYIKVAKFKSLPEGEVLDFYNSSLSEIEGYYSSYGQSSYGSLDSFATTYLNLDSKADWRAYLRQQAEYQVKQMLVFYYVTQREGFVPTEEEFKVEYRKLYDEAFERYLESKEFSRDDYKTEELYQNALEGHKKTFDAYYGEEYFKENVYFKFGLERIKAFANLIEQ